MSFTAQKSREGSVHVLALSGEIDFAVIDRFDATMADAIATAKSPLLVDLRDVSYIDSATLGRLIEAHKELDAKGDYFGVVVSGGMVARIFEITSLRDVLQVHANLADGIAAAERFTGEQ